MIRERERSDERVSHRDDVTNTLEFADQEGAREEIRERAEQDEPLVKVDQDKTLKSARSIRESFRSLLD